MEKEWTLETFCLHIFGLSSQLGKGCSPTYTASRLQPPTTSGAHTVGWRIPRCICTPWQGELVGLCVFQCVPVCSARGRWYHMTKDDPSAPRRVTTRLIVTKEPTPTPCYHSPKSSNGQCKAPRDRAGLEMPTAVPITLFLPFSPHWQCSYFCWWWWQGLCVESPWWWGRQPDGLPPEPINPCLGHFVLFCKWKLSDDRLDSNAWLLASRCRGDQGAYYNTW